MFENASVLVLLGDNMFGNALVLALIGTGFSFLGTALGSAMVFFMRKDLSVNTHKIFLGFASGVMIAASVWSLLIPAMNMAEEQNMISWIHVSSGFLFGGLFLYVLDKILPHLHTGSNTPEGPKSTFKRSTMLVLAVTLHNIPEGMAVGLAFAMAASSHSEATMEAAMVLALGMALQNFPEGATISLPLRNEGISKMKAFIYGALSGIVEPIAGIIGVVLALTIVHIMPFMLSFAAGAMIYVVIEELVPEAYNEHSHCGTISAMIGFTIMMVLDITLG